MRTKITRNKLGFVAVVVLVAFVGCTPEAPNAPVTEAIQAPVTTVSSDEPIVEIPAKKQAEVALLVGSWERTDSPYVIEIRNVGNDGSLDAAYFNPKPINVGDAEAHHTGDKLEVIVELDDVNYPGSKYTLTYDAVNDALVGVYFQAVARQSFAVSFKRKP